MNNLVFKDLFVVELAGVLAGPALGMFFAELGAKVLKVENAKTGGDITRAWKLPSESPEAAASAYFASVNWGKEMLHADLENEEDQELVMQHIARADVLISNFKPASARRLGMDYERIKVLNPRIIYAQILAFRHDERIPAFDMVLQAEAGFLHMSGEAGRPPVRMPVALIDLLAAHQLKAAVLIALMQRQSTGKGAYVQTSLMESALASLANQASNWLMEGHIPQPLGSLHPNIAPYGELFVTADEKRLVMAAGSDAQFRGLCAVLNLSHLIHDERFMRNPDRVRHRQELAEILQAAIAQHRREDLLAALWKAGVPAGAVRNMEEVFAQDFAREMVLEYDVAPGQRGRCVKTVAFELWDQDPAQPL